MQSLLRRAHTQGTPLIDGNSVTFIWEGSRPPLLVYDPGDWLENPVNLERVAPNTWAHTIELDPRAYLEYAYLDPDTGQRPSDPFNPRRTPNGLGETNQYFYMPEARPHPLTRRQKGVLRGQVSRHAVPTRPFYGPGSRRVDLYRPVAEKPVPLLVVYDGNDYSGRGKLLAILDNLIHQNRIAPIAAALVSNNPRTRFVEYACSDATVAFISEYVLPLASAELNLLDITANPGAFGILGASMGGMMALYTSLRLPEVFGRAACQSGAYAMEDHEFVVFELVRHLPVEPFQLWMDVGRYVFLLDSNRKMHELLVSQGFVHAYREYYGGHNYTSWRNDVWQGLEYLFSLPRVAEPAGRTENSKSKESEP
jgi:enterochelin esterase family protein